MHWSDVEKIAIDLEKHYSDEEIPEFDLPYLEEMVVSLPNFEDHEGEASDETLNQIIEHWIEIRHER